MWVPGNRLCGRWGEPCSRASGALRPMREQMATTSRDTHPHAATRKASPPPVLLPSRGTSLEVAGSMKCQLDQRLLTLRADLGERGGLALRRGKDASSRGAGGSPAEVAGEAGEESALQEKHLMRPCGHPLRAAPGHWGPGPLGRPSRQGPPLLLPTLS